MTRRDWLGAGMAAPVLLAKAAPQQPCRTEDRRTRIAAIVTVYRYYSHADVLVGRLLSGYSANAIWEPSNTHVVSLHAVQVPANVDMSREMAARNGFHIYPSIRETLTLGGGSLAVDGVVFVGEHGDYPLNDVGQQLYPRYELFSQILDVYEQSGRSVPTFFDKHFSYSWEKADAIYRRAKKIGFPFMAGSSIPLTIRKPAAGAAARDPHHRGRSARLWRPGRVRLPHARRPAMPGGAPQGRRDGNRVGPVDRRRGGDPGMARRPAGGLVESAVPAAAR